MKIITTVLALGSAALAINQKFAKNFTVFHVNPAKYGAVPLNMDTGDSYGDMFFDLHNAIAEPLECPLGASSGHGCDNPEVDDKNLAVNKLVLEMDYRFSGYAKCNIGVNGTDGHGNVCADDTYCCYCSAGGTAGRAAIPCNATVGRENVRDYFGRSSSSSHGGRCKEGSPDYECFRTNAAKKFTVANPGWWYSTLDTGACSVHPGSATNCTWRVVTVEKRVTKACRNEKFFGAVEDVDKTCFNTCPKGAGLGRNTSDACWIRCFYKAVVGQDADKPINGTDMQGIPLNTLVGMWEKAFDDESAGGCPPLEIS